jgi:hypothetical protein
MTQPTPTVTAADVERIVRRDFPNRVSDALAILAEYGPDSWHNEPHRVRAAVLKLANGNLDHLKREIATARADYRDVLAYAEYPDYFRRVSGHGSLPEDQISQIIAKDWKQYQEWFQR